MNIAADAMPIAQSACLVFPFVFMSECCVADPVQRLGRTPKRIPRVTRMVPAALLTLAAGIAGSVQVALMSRLGERIGVLEALGFSVALTGLLGLVVLLLARQSLAGYGRALHQPWWMLGGGVMGLLIVFTVTYAGPRIGVAATVGILIAGQLIMGAAIDRFGLFGSERIALHWPRVVGLALLAAGAALSLRK